jgi:hypothetical protein
MLSYKGIFCAGADLTDAVRQIRTSTKSDGGGRGHWHKRYVLAGYFADDLFIGDVIFDGGLANEKEDNAYHQRNDGDTANP